MKSRISICTIPIEDVSRVRSIALNYHGIDASTRNSFAPRVHARSAVSVAQVPFGACVEIDMIAELRATRVGGSI
jgi:enamine deaminase RidA (YjgF/YER057c/UK114 family)